MWDRYGIVIVILHQIWYRESDFLVISPWFSRDFSVIFQWFMKWQTSGRVRDVIFHQFFSYNRDFTVIPSLREVKPCKHNLNHNYNLIGFDTIEINLVDKQN